MPYTVKGAENIKINEAKYYHQANFEAERWGKIIQCDKFYN